MGTDCGTPPRLSYSKGELVVLQCSQYVVVPHSSQCICWPLTSLFPSLVGHGVLQTSLSAAFTSVHQPWPDALWPELGEMPVYSHRPPLLLTFDAALHLYFVFLMLSHLYLLTNTAYTAYKTAVECHHSHCSYDGSSGVGFGWALGFSSSVLGKRGHFLSLSARRMVLVYTF